MKHSFVAFLGPYSLSISLCVILPPALPFLMSLTSELQLWGGGGEHTERFSTSLLFTTPNYN